MKLSCKGFFSIQFIFFLLIISALLLSYGFIFYAQKQKDLFRKVCYFDLVDIQRNLVRAEKQLFLLNPQSTALRLRLKALYLELAAATAAQNYALAAQINLDIQSVVQLQKNLDGWQKLIIQQAQRQLKAQLWRLHQDLVSTYNHEHLLWRTWVEAQRRYKLKTDVILAVQPDSIGGWAPNYELQKHYEVLQELQLDLHHRFSNQRNTQMLLNTQKKFHFFCQISFSQKEQEWNLKINQDRL